MTHRPLIQGTLFSGIGAPEFAAKQLGWLNAFNCEINPFCRQILKYHYPNAEQYKDITQADFSFYRGIVDILTGGFPCQGFSLAGARLGTEDARYLWPAMLEAIEAIRPTWVIGENVGGLASMEDRSGSEAEILFKMASAQTIRTDALDSHTQISTREAKMLLTGICESLEERGFEVQIFNLPAASVGAPHRRERLFILAYSDSNRQSSLTEYAERKEQWLAGKLSPNPADLRRGGGEEQGRPNNTHQQRGLEEEKRQDGNKVRGKVEGCCGNATDPNGLGQQRQGRPKRQGNSGAYQEWKASWANDDGGWPTESPLLCGDDGLSQQLHGITLPRLRRLSVEAYGNAIIPQILIEIFKGIDTAHFAEL